MESAFNTTPFNNGSYDDYENVPQFEVPGCPEGGVLIIAKYYPDSLVELFTYRMTDKVILTMVYPFIVTLGFLANSFFLFTLVRVKRMRTNTNIYLGNLAVADLFFVVITAVNYFTRYLWSPTLQRGVPWSSAPGCVAISTAVYLPYFASIGLVTLVSFERFLAICYPLKHRMVNTKSRTIKLIVTTWLAAFILTGVVAPNYAEHQIFCIVWPDHWSSRLPSIINYCNAVATQFIEISAVVQFIPFILALIINTILYGVIIYRLGQREVIHEGNDATGSNSQANKVRNAVARMLVINGIAYFICYTPFQFYNMYYFAVRNCSECKVLPDDVMFVIGWIGRCSSVLNSAINPLIYGATNKRYRQAFLTAIGGCHQTDTNGKSSDNGVVTTSVANSRM